MAVVINGAKIDEQIYEFGIEREDGLVDVYSYEKAKANAASRDRPLKMRCVYYTEWMDAQ